MAQSLDELKRRLQSSAIRLSNLLNLNGPPIVVSNEAVMLFRMAMALYPDEMGQALGNMIARPLRSWHGLCFRCGDPVAQGYDQCLSCRALEAIACAEDEAEMGGEGGTS